MGFRGSVVTVVLVAFFIGGETKEHSDACSADAGSDMQSGDKLIQLKAKDSKMQDVATLGLMQLKAKDSKGKAVTEEDACAPQYCMFYGDPHMRTFDGASTMLQKNGLFWIVKSDLISIQGVAQWWGRTQKIAATGPFLRGADGKDHKLTFSVGTNDEVQVWWDGAQILQTEKEYVVPGLVNLRHLSTNLASLEHMEELPEHNVVGMREMRSWGQGLTGGHNHFKLPKNVEVFVASLNHQHRRHAHMAELQFLVKIPKNLGPFEGVCGNMNGNPKDDQPALTSDSDSIMLQTASSGCPEGCEDCEAAMKACGNFKQASFRDSCIFDGCHGVDPEDAAEAVLAAELMEVEDARNIPTFVGNGICLDSNGNEYTNYENSDVTSVDDCKKALGMGVPGLWGAQMKPGGDCHLLVDPNHVSLHSYTKVSDGTGSGMVSSVEPKEGYSCWKVV